MTTDPSGAWLELRELHSSLNYLKDKLNKTGQKLSAASCSGPIEFNFTSLPSSLASSSNCVPLSRVATSASSLINSKRCRSGTHTTGKRNALNGIPLSQAQSRERGHIPCELSPIENGALLHHGEVEFMRSLRQPSTRSSFVPSGTAITTTNNVTFTIDGIVTEHSLSTGGLSVKKAHYINDELRKQSRSSGSKALVGSSKKLRRLVEKQKKAAEHRHSSVKSPQHQTDRIASHVDAHTSPDVTRGFSPRLVDAATDCRPHSATFATHTSATRGHEQSKKLLEGHDISRSSVIPDIVENSSLPSEDCVEGYLDYLKNRATIGRAEEARGEPNTAENVLGNGLQGYEYPFESDCLGLAWNEASVDPVWKRKFASVRQPKQYRGFSLTVDPSTRRKPHQPTSKGGKTEGACELPLAPIETAVQTTETTGECRSTCAKVVEKANAVRPTKPAGITTTSWKEGRDLALKRHGPSDASVDAAAISEEHPRKKTTTTYAQARPLPAEVHREKSIIPNAARVAALRNLQRNRSVKRKALHTMEQEGNAPVPATKLRHCDSPAVNDFIMKQKLGRRQQKRSSERCIAEAAQARQQRLERLYTFQRKTASESARIGREKVRRQQEDEQLVHGFVEHLKSAQNEFNQKDTPHMFCPGSNLKVASANDDLDEKCGMQLVKSQGVQVGGVNTCNTTDSEISQDGLSCQSSHSASCTSGHLQYFDGDIFKPQQPTSTDTNFTMGTPVGCERPLGLEQVFQYEPTELVVRLTQMTSSLNEKLDEQLQMLGCDVPLQAPEFGEHHPSMVTERIQRMVAAFEIASKPQPEVHDCAFQHMRSSKQSSDKAPDSQVHAQVQHDAAKKIQHFFRHCIRNRKKALEKGHHGYNRDGGMKMLSCILEESSLPQSSKPSVIGSKPSVLDEEPSYHLMPDPNTIARAWKKKSVKGAAAAAPTPRKMSAPPTLSEGLQRENEYASGGTSAEGLTSLLEEDTGAPSSSFTTSHRNATVSVQSSKSEGAPEKMLPDKPAVLVVDSHSMARSLSKPKEAAGKAGGQDLQQHRHSKSSETSLVPVRDSKVAIGAFGVFGRSEPLRASLDSNRAWDVLETQAKALQASAETVRQLAQVRAPSLVELHGEDMVQRLTASTVVAASALAAALASQRPDWQAPKDKCQRRDVYASSSSSTSQPTDAGFESNDKTSPQSSAEESCSPQTGSGKQVLETQLASRQDGSNASMDDSERSGSSGGESISEELDTLGFSDSSLDRKKSNSGTSKKRQTKNVPPRSLESSATEDSAGPTNLQVGRQSSLSETPMLDRDLLSYGSLTERPLTSRPSGIELVEEKEGGDHGPPGALLRLQEHDIIERARADFTWIEVLKRNCREKGTEDKLPALRKRERAVLIRLHQKRMELKALQSQCLAQSLEGGSLASASNVTSIPTHGATEVAEASARGVHSSGISEPYEPPLLGNETSGQSKESSKPEEVPSKGEQKSSLPNSYDSTFESSGTFPEFEDSTHLKLNASQRFLEERQQKLQSRRKHVQQLLEWQKKLNTEEANVRALERRALAKLRARGAKTPPQGKLESSVTTSVPSQLDAQTSKSKGSGEPKSVTYPEDASFEEEVSEEVDAKATSVTESIQEEVTRTESTSGGHNQSTIESKVVTSVSSEAEVSTQTEGAMKRSSNGSRKGLLLIKKPLVVRRKVRRDSSGSEDSFNVSLSETASDQSDIEGRIIALSEELKKRQLEAEQLKREQRRRRTEMLREREESLKKHIELYDKLIQQAKEELEKELDVAQHEKTAFVKPQIKKPRAAEQRKHRLVHLTVHLSGSENGAQSALMLQNKDQKPCPGSLVATPSASSKKSESEIGTEEEHTNEGTSFASSSAEGLTPKLATPSVSQKSTEKPSPRVSALSTSSDIVEELSSKEVAEPSSSESTEVLHFGAATLSDGLKSAEESCSQALDAKLNLEGFRPINTEATEAATSQDNTSVPAETTSEPISNVAAAAVIKSTTDLTLRCSPDGNLDSAASSGEDISEHISVTASESDSHEQSTKGKLNACEQPVGEPYVLASDRSECQNDTTSDGVFSSLGGIEASLGHEVKELSNRSTDEGLSDDEVQVLGKTCSDKVLALADDLEVASGLKEASSPAGSKSTDSSGWPSSQDDESTVAEEVAEYTEEIVRSVVIVSNQSCEERIEEGRVNEAVNSILRYLMEDAIESLVRRRGPCVQHAEKFLTGQEASSIEAAIVTQNEYNPSADVLADNEHLTVPLKEAVTTAADISIENKLVVEVCSDETLPAGVVQIERAEAAESFENLEQSDQPWDMEQINAIADKLVSEAIDSVLAIAKEEGLLSAVSVESGSQVSNVSQKVNAILASIEEPRNSREFQRPQDLMVLSTDLDDEEFSWKDASAVPVHALSEDAPSEAGAKALCSRAVQAEDCFLSTTTEQDWFDDDFGLGSGDNALGYQRRIPNKPPPPYSPPKGGFMSRLFSEAAWKVPNTESEVSALVRKAAATVYTTVMQGRSLAELAFNQEYIDEKAPAKAFITDTNSHHAYCEFLFDLVKETARELFCTEATDMPPPPWQRSVRLRRKQPLPSTLESFVHILERKVMSVPGLHENSELAFRNFDNRGLSFVDMFVYSEARSEEPEWVDYSREEVVVKDQVATAIFQLLVDDTLEVLKSLWQLR
ncbi:uncharacterized protein LOC144115064 isoform X2 [Amblyomma americanum]